MDKIYRDKNLKYCKIKIAECDLGISKAEIQDEDIDALVERRTGFEERLKEFEEVEISE